jgi:hypothetical protein
LATKILIDIIETDKQFELKGILLPTNLIKRNSVKVIKNPELTEKIRATVITT